MADMKIEWEEWRQACVVPEETRTEWALELMEHPDLYSTHSGDSIVLCLRREDGTMDFIDALVRRTATVRPAEPPPKATP